jgi:hypothetical protein
MGMEPYTFAGKPFYGHAGGGDNYEAWLDVPFLPPSSRRPLWCREAV